MVDLGKWEKEPDKNKFSFRTGPITHKKYGWDWLISYRRWKIGVEQSAFFHVFVFAYVLRWYIGKYKVDGSRTRWYWGGLLQEPGDPIPNRNWYVVNDYNKSERWALRLHATDLDVDRWDNMAGI